MVLKIRERMGREEGFTLVELLVVMLILGILAAIAIPAFFNQRDKARDAKAKEAVRTAQTAIETYATDNNGAYTGATAANLATIEPTLNETDLDGDGTLEATELAVTVPAANQYTVEVFSEVTGQRFRIVRAANGTTALTCDVDGTAGCPSDGNWD